MLVQDDNDNDGRRTEGVPAIPYFYSELYFVITYYLQNYFFYVSYTLG